MIILVLFMQTNSDNININADVSTSITNQNTDETNLTEKKQLLVRPTQQIDQQQNRFSDEQ